MEIYYHLIEAELVHRHFTRGSAGAASSANVNTPPSAYQPGGKGEQGKYAKFPPLQRRILEVLEEMMPANTQGVHVTDIAHNLKFPASIDEIGSTMEKLAEEGQIYATIDDEHFAIS
ncbi:replication factor A protein 2 [Ceratobasidium sp. 395]|nr:replication factor A protein 2 [Ceratobasidium sp. 395]